MSLAVLTQRGQEFAAEEQLALEAYCAAFPHLSFLRFEQDNASVADAIFHEDGVARLVAEVKSRDCSLERFRGEFRNEWMISLDKFLHLGTVAGLLRVPAIGILHLRPPGLILVQEFFDAKGFLSVHYRPETRTTQGTCNGGSKTEKVALVRMDRAKAYPV